MCKVLSKRMAKEGTKMSKLKHRQLAKRLVIKGIKKYREKFILEEDLLSGVDRAAILKEIDSILKDVNADDRNRLIAERNYYKKQVEELEAKLNRFYSLDDCDEEFEM